MLVALLVGRYSGLGHGEAVIPDVPVCLAVLVRTGRVLEPLVLIGRVVQHHIDNDPHPPALCLAGEPIEVGQGPKLWVDILMIRYVVTEIDLRRRVERRNPDRADAEMLQVVEVLGDAVQIADAVAVRIPVAAWVDLVEDCLLPPWCRIALLLGAGVRQR